MPKVKNLTEKYKILTLMQTHKKQDDSRAKHANPRYWREWPSYLV